MELKSQQAHIADAVLAKLKERFGTDFYNLLTTKIAHDYFNDKIHDISTSLITNPSVFERAFLGLIGPLGEDVLVNVCEKVQSDLDLDNSTRYSKIGDFAKYIEVVSHDR